MRQNSPSANPPPSHDVTSALRILAGGILGMMVAMGIGRFAFTPILPLMQRDLGMSHAVAGWLASLNYLGYLAGAVACSLFPRLLRNGVVNGGALLASIATTFLMGATQSPAWWGVLRGIGGAASAVLFVVIAVEVTEALVRYGCSRWAGTLYGGVGLGIAVSGSMVPLLDHLGGWRIAWLGIGSCAALLALGGVMLAHKRSAALPALDAPVTSGGSLRSVVLLAAAYFFEGLGYIVSATFLVAMFARTRSLESFAPLSWVAVGIAAAPSTLFWQQAARRLGPRSALVLAYGIQAAGILLSIRAHTAEAACLAAVCFGGTFLGIVALVMAEGNRRSGRSGHRVAAILTACFGAGQVIGPPLAGLMADARSGFALPLLLAAGAVAIGGTLIATDTGFRRSRQ